MPIDASIPLAYRAPQIDNPMNMLAQAMQIQVVQNQNALAQYSISKAKRQDDETNQLAQLMRQPGFDLTSPEGQRQAYGVAPTVTPSFLKSQLDQRKTIADTGKSTSEAGKFDMDAASKRLDMIGQAFGAVRNQPDPQTANAAIDALQQQGVFSPQVAAQHKQAIASDPMQIKRMADMYYTSALNAKDQLPQFQTRNTGALTQTLAINPVSGAVNVANSAQNTVSPDAQLQANTSRANNAANIAKDLQVVGMSPGGGMDDNSERTAQAIANGQLPAPTGMALLNPRNQRILGRVMEINPKYDFTDVTAKKAAATAFTSGPQGNALRSIATANAHLSQLGDLVDALDNGNLQVANRVGNYFATQTGDPKVSDFESIKNIVGQEVVKAMVPGAGGEGERDKAAAAFDAAKSPQQLKSVISHYRAVMGAQQTNLLVQRRAAGLPDSTLADYSQPTGNANPVTSAIDAELARRGGR